MTPVRFEGGASGRRPVPDGFEVFVADVAALAGRCDASVLDEAEASRAEAFARTEDRDRYTVAHVMLRQLLASYLDCDPAAVSFRTEPCPLCGGPHGRPAVAGRTGLHFSLSHGGGYAMAAFAASPIGVDVEPVPGPEILADLLGCLDGAERRDLASLAEPARPVAFARAWVRKEARLKALGTGLAVDPATVHAGVSERAAAGTTDLDAPAGHAAAVHLLERGGAGAVGHRRVDASAEWTQPNWQQML